MKGMGSHQSAKMMNDEWLTPPEILEYLGPFDLDPCAPVHRPWAMATRHYTKEDNGLIQAWDGRIWCNPPYGRATGEWLAKLSEHGNGMALIFARTETRTFFEHVWPKAHAVHFIQGRLHFFDVMGTRAKANAGAPSVLVAYGAQCAQILSGTTIPGQFVQLKHY